MYTIGAVNILAILASILLLIFRRKSTRPPITTAVRALLMAGLVPLVLQVAIYLLFGIGEMASGDLSGAGHLLPAVATALLAVLSWKQPLEGACALFIVGIVTCIEIPQTVAIVIMATPQFISGFLFLLAGWTLRGMKPPEIPETPETPTNT